MTTATNGQFPVWELPTSPASTPSQFTSRLCLSVTVALPSRSFSPLPSTRYLIEVLQLVWTLNY